MKGKLAIAKAGHDKGRIYVVIAEKESSVILADGRIRTVDKPKEKNRKHVQVIQRLPQEVQELLSQEETYRDEVIKRAIKLYQKSKCI